MAVEEVSVVGLKEVLVKLLVLVPAHPPVKPVHRLALGRRVKEHLPGLGHPGCGLRVQLHGAVFRHHLVHVLKGQVAAGQNQRFHHSSVLSICFVLPALSRSGSPEGQYKKSRGPVGSRLFCMNGSDA